MLNPMPHKLIRRNIDMTNVKLEDFFGYSTAYVGVPPPTG